ncbi:MAG: hypothetical protein EA391_10220 [Balneolaceae bacterium]|nr:MAG: hypothetical protein EA391_10220 [Balneolaceae bacterium]
MKTLITSLLLLIFVDSLNAQSDNLHISGYVQGMPVWISADLPEPFNTDSFWEYRLQNRLNVRYDISPSLTFNWQMRTRFFAGSLVNELNDIPGVRYSDLIDIDDGIVDLSWIIADRDTWLLHYIPDRLNIDWQNGDWRITAGRQRVNWGINMVSNPNDLFNIYSFYEFDYPERPGTDAIRIQHFIDWASRVEVAFSPARNMRNSVGAALYGFDVRGYDLQLIAGYFRHMFAAGGGWAGNIGESGFKGEVMFFSGLDKPPAGNRETNLVAALSVDHMFENSLFLVVEGLYNKEGGRDEFLLLGEPLAANNPSFSRYQLTTVGSYPFNPVWDGSLALIWYPDEGAVFLSPSITHSLTQDIDVNILAQIFAGSDDSVFSNAGSVIAGSVKWNF